MRKAKTCIGCKAYWVSDGIHHCDLGYPQTANGEPEIECPKPRTNLALCSESIYNKENKK